MNLKNLAGSGRKIGLVTFPFLITGLILNYLYPVFFQVGGPSPWLMVISCVILIPGIILWIWSVVLILKKIPRNELITTGPFALMKHPLYTSVALLVLPWAGILCNSWLGFPVGIILYTGSRIFSPEEEKSLAEVFGPAWEAYTRKVWMKWL